MKYFNKLRLSFIFIFLLLILTSVWISREIYHFGDLQMDMDEAIHANRGLDMASDIRGRDWQKLWLDFSKPEWYPPGHGILSGVWLLVLGPSIEVARLYSTFLYLVFGLVLWFSIREILPGENPLLYLIPSLFLFTDALHIDHAAMAMLEIPSITFAFAGLLYLNRANRSYSLKDHFLTFLFGLLCFFTKYNYGLVLFTVYAISHARTALNYFLSRPKPFHIPKNMHRISAFWGLFALVVILWFLVLGQWRWFAAYAVAQPVSYSLWSVRNLTYYPKKLVTESLTWLAILLSMAGAIQLCRKRKYPGGITPYLLFFFINLILLTLKLQNSSRFAMPLYPSLWMIAGLGFQLLVTEFPSRVNKNTSYSLIISGLLLAGIINFYNYQFRLSTVYENTNDGVDQAYGFIAEVLDTSNQGDLQIVMLGRTDLWNGQALHFHLESRCLLAGNSCHISVQDRRELRRGYPEQVYSEEVQQQRIQEALDEANYQIHFYENPSHPEGWELVSELEFTFEYIFDKRESVWVSIYKP